MSNSRDKKQLGSILLRHKLITGDQLDNLLSRQENEPSARLGAAAVDSGVVSEVGMLRALSEQHGVPGIDVAQIVVPLNNLRLLPFDIARQYLILPFSVEDEHLFLAMADPSDKRVIDEIEFVTGRRVFPYVALSSSLADLIYVTYRMLDDGGEYYIAPNAPQSYLDELGLDRPSSVPHVDTSALPQDGPAAVAHPLSSPPGAPNDAFVKETVAQLSDTHADGLAETMLADGPALDAAFDSVVARLPSEEGDAIDASTRKIRNILVVDDDDDIRRMIARVLDAGAYRVAEAANGTGALEMLKSDPPDCIVLDAMLPGVHGFDICRRIKGSKKYGHIPVIMVTAIYRGWRFEQDLKESYGVSSLIEKPFRVADLIEAIETALGNSEEDDAERLSEAALTCLQSGLEAYRKGDLEYAIREVIRGIEIDPLAFRLHYHLGLLYGRCERTFEGIHELTLAVDLAPKNFAALKNLAVLYQRAGFKHKSVELWERAMQYAPDDEVRFGIKEHLMTLL